MEIPLAYNFLGYGCTLYPHHDVLYVTCAQDGHMHALSDPPCDVGRCAWDDEEFVASMRAHETDLWQCLAVEPVFWTCYDVDTETWHPERVAIDDAGRPYLLPCCPWCGRLGNGLPCDPPCAEHPFTDEDEADEDDEEDDA